MQTHSDSELNNALDWDLVVWSRLNAILCGPQATIDAAFSSLRGRLEPPLHEWSFTSGSPLPSINGGTLVVSGFDGTALDEQRAFLDWLDAHHAVRVITLTEVPLYDLVQSGSMLESLYYRLNSIYCALDPNCTSGSLGRSSAA